MVEFVETFDGHATRGGHLVDSLFRMPTCSLEEGNCPLHGLQGDLFGLMGIEAHLATTFHLGTNVTHHIGNATRCHHHAWTHEVFCHNKGVTINGIEFLHCLQALISGSR